jgi:outer membrane protein assembly factor BamB
MKRIALLLVLVLVFTNGASGAMSAKDVVGKTGVAGGLCSFPRLAQADDPLALDLAKRPTFVIHAMARDAKGAARARAAAEAKGLLGRSMYVEVGGASKLPFADRLVDLLVVTDLADADLMPELRAEWLRVLAPRRGAALVGRAKAAGAGLSSKALSAWIKGLPLAKIINDDSGLWALLRVELPAGSDSWSHRCHGPGNAQVSTDTTVQAPFLTQWWGLPRQESFWGMTVVSENGRIFSIRASRRRTDSVFLTARSLTSGVVLWQKLLRQAPEGVRVAHGGYVPSRSCAVAFGDTLCLVEKDAVLRLDAETGKLRDRITGPKPDGQVKWLASAGGMLMVLAGEADVITPISYQTVAGNPVGRELAVYDGKSKRELWRATADGDIDERMIAVRGKHLYAVEQGVGVVCRELGTGKKVWTSTDADIKNKLRTPDPKKIRSLLVSQPALLALDDALLVRAQWTKELVALSRKDGRVLWRKSSLPWGGKGAQSFQRSLTGVPVDGKWVAQKGSIDLKTGQKVKGPRFVSDGCGPTLATPKYLITCWGKVMTMPGGKYLRRADIKAPCDIGTVVSEGMVVSMPSQCACSYELKGYRALTSARGIQPHAAPPWQQRLTVVDSAEPAALKVTDADWPTYRHDASRSGATAASVGSKPRKVLWHWKPKGAVAYSSIWKASAGPKLAPDYQATAAVAAAGRVWFASHDGVVRCVKADTGEQVWTFATGAKLFAPPTVWSGRLLVGGGDGYIYCLDASTGRLLWRFTAGPLDRRVFWFGHLTSTWPVVTGVAVQDGVAYAAAGFQKENGIHAYAMDPKTGKVIWEKHNTGANPWNGSGSAGHCALGGGRMWLASSPDGSLDLKTGDWKPLGGYNFGCEVGVMDKWVIHGGRRLSETQDTLGSPLKSTGFSALSTDAKPGRFKLNGTGTTLPVWDGQLAVMPPVKLSGGLIAAPTAKLLPWLAGKYPAGSKLSRRAKGVDIAEIKSWATPAILPAAIALAKDKLIVAGREGRSSYRLVVFNRTDGTKAWSVDLPEQPVMNRLAIDRDGRIIVALCDGSMRCLGK